MVARPPKAWSQLSPGMARLVEYFDQLAEDRFGFFEFIFITQGAYIAAVADFFKQRGLIL